MCCGGAGARFLDIVGDQSQEWTLWGSGWLRVGVQP